MEVVYKIMTLGEWAETTDSGLYAGSALDLADGFIHLSTAVQVEDTVTRHFANCGNLILAAISVKRVGAALRFEPSRGGNLFPHLYANVKIKDILWAKEFESHRPDQLRKFIME